MKPTRLINGRGNFQFSHEKHPNLEQSGFCLPSSTYMVLQLQQVHVSEGGLCWLDCMFESATLKSYVLLLNTRMFLSKCKKAYVHAEYVKVKTKSFMSFLNVMQNSQCWQWLAAVPPPLLLQKCKCSHMWSSTGLIKDLTYSIINHHSGELPAVRAHMMMEKICFVGNSLLKLTIMLKSCCCTNLSVS